MRNTVSKLSREHFSRCNQKDVDIIAQFEEDPFSFLDNSADLAVDIKLLYDKRIQQVKERNQMNTYHIENITDKDLERCGVSKREFSLIKKLMKMDPQIFAVKEFKDSSPYTYTVDLSKYEKVPQDCKEVLFRPQKMRQLYERYWAIASDLDKEDAAKTVEHRKLRTTTRRLPKGEEEYVLMDKIVEIIDNAIETQKKALIDSEFGKDHIVPDKEF